MTDTPGVEELNIERNRQVVTTLVALPGKCRMCGSGNKDWYFDTGYSEEYWGAVYYCCDCVTDIANKCNFLTPGVKRLLEDKIDRISDENFQQLKQLASLRKVRDGINSFNDSVTSATATDELLIGTPVLEAVEERKGKPAVKGS